AVRRKAEAAPLAMPGRTRLSVYDPDQHLFFVTVADPPVIAVLDARGQDQIARQISVPARGPHGLDLDRSRSRLYCACDQGILVGLDSHTGAVIARLELSGPPDVVFLNSLRSLLYVAVEDPGVIDIVDVSGWVKIGTVATE